MARSEEAERSAAFRKRFPAKHREQQRLYKARKKAAAEQKLAAYWQGIQAMVAAERKETARRSEMYARAKAAADAAGLSIELWFSRLPPAESAAFDVHGDRERLIKEERDSVRRLAYVEEETRRSLEYAFGKPACVDTLNGGLPAHIPSAKEESICWLKPGLMFD